MATIGLFLVAFGSALSIVINLGTTPLSCLAYVLNLKYGAISLGTFHFFINLCYMLVQVLIWRKAFKAEYLMQLIAALIFSIFIDLSISVLGFLAGMGFGLRIALTVVAAIIIALGTSIEVVSKAWMLSAEMTVSAITSVSNGDFGKTKIAMDCTMVIIAAVLAFVFFGNLIGASYSGLEDLLFARSEGIVIGIGTLILAILPGYFMRYSDKLVAALRPKA